MEINRDTIFSWFKLATIEKEPHTKLKRKLQNENFHTDDVGTESKQGSRKIILP